jgi:hypothetical protein
MRIAILAPMRQELAPVVEAYREVRPARDLDRLLANPGATA